MIEQQLVMDQDTSQSALNLIRMAFQEDLGGQVDCTSWATIPANVDGHAQFVAREAGVICGLSVTQLIADYHGQGISLQLQVEDGSKVLPGTVIADLRGPAREILRVERTCLNFIGRLSGIATLTAEFVALADNDQVAILDTRKTTPGWRLLEKFAVQSGGGTNHRMGLYDAILIKDNHIAMCGALPGRSIREIIQLSRDWVNEHADTLPRGRQTIVEVEVDRIPQLIEALEARADIVLLDNMSVEELQEAVELRNRHAAGVLLEASGGVNLRTVASIAATGVDRISIGALTHSATNFDVGLDWVQANRPAN